MADAKKYRDEAERIRQEAAETVDVNRNRLLRQLADLYERLARCTEKQRAGPKNH